MGGAGTTRLTPNFRLSEFQTGDGKCRVHRELVTAIQVLRERFGKPLKIAAVMPDGLGAVLRAEPAADLARAAAEVRLMRLLDSVEQQGGDVHVRMPDPDALPDIPVEQAIETAFLVTSGFETSGDKFQQITGNFDGAGLSFGPAQVNFGTGTLQPLFAKFRQADETALRSCFADADDFAEFMAVLAKPVEQQIAWANTISTGRSQSEVIEPWRTHFHNVGKVPRFREITAASIFEDYGAKLTKAIQYLNKVRPDIRIDHLRCICALWDLVIQQGSVDFKNPKRGIDVPRAIDERVHRENPKDQFELVRIAVEERAKVAAEAFRNDCASRRLGLLNGVPTTVGSVQRANIQFYLLRDVRIPQDVELANLDVPKVIARASTVIATGAGLFTA